MNKHLSLELFTNVSEDFEKRQYLILGKLREVREEFQHNRLYPHLGVLIDLHRKLEQLIQGFHNLKESGPKKIRKIDLLNKQIEFESELPKQLDLSAVEDLIEWALPLINEAIKEGITIYEFAEQNINIQNVGIEPTYKTEGYSFIFDAANARLHLFRYEISVLAGPEENYRSLRTTFLKSISTSVEKPLNTIKLDLINDYKDLPNPATYSIRPEVDFPFNQTILPISKRKLLRYIIS